MTKAARKITKIKEKSKKSRNQSCENHQGGKSRKTRKTRKSRKTRKTRNKHEKRANGHEKRANGPEKARTTRIFKNAYQKPQKTRAKMSEVARKKTYSLENICVFLLCLPLTSRLVAVLVLKQNGPCHKGNIASFLKTEITPAAALPCC
jgi:hypothetical protein